MNYLLLLCFSLSAQHTIKMNVTADNQKTSSTIYVKNEFVMSISKRLSQIYNAKTNELFKIDFKGKRLLKQSFKKAEKLKSMISPFISGNKTSDKNLKKKVLGFKVIQRDLENNSSAAKINASFIVTKQAKKLTRSLAAYMKRLRDLIPFEFPIKNDELVLEMTFKWKLNSMAKMFLRGKNKRFIQMNTSMKITSIEDGISDKKLFRDVLSFDLYE